MFKKWQAITLWKRVLIGLAIGMSLGLTLRYTIGPAQPTIEFFVGVDQAVTEPAEKSSDSVTLTTSENTAIDIDIFNVTKYDRKTSKAKLVSVSNPENGTTAIVDDNNFTFTPEANWTGETRFKCELEIPHQVAKDFATTWIKPFGEAFVRLIKMLIIPLIATTLVAGVTAMGDPKKLGSLGVRTIGLYLLTTFFAVTLGLIVGTIVQPGVGVDYQTASAEAIKSVEGKIEGANSAGSAVDLILNIIPENPVQALATGAVLPTIFFSILLGIGILVAGKVADPVKNFFESASEVVMKITIIVMELAPYGVLALMAWVMAEHGIEVLYNVGKLAFSLYLACAIQIFLIYGMLLIKGFLRLPLKQFFRGIADAQGVAFSTASSNATLPVTISCAETNLGVDKSVAGSVLPLGATINMDGTAIYLGLIALFAVQAGGGELTMTQYMAVALTATLASIGAAGIPSAGLLLAATVLGVVGIGEAQSVLVIAFIFPFDRLLDMMRTVTNISGDIAVACTVAKWEGALDEETFRREAEV